MSYETFKATPINWAESYTSTNNSPDKLNPCLSISFTYFDPFNSPSNYWSFLWKDKLEDYRKERLLAKSVCSASNHNSARLIKPREITLCNFKKRPKNYWVSNKGVRRLFLTHIYNSTAWLVYFSVHTRSKFYPILQSTDEANMLLYSKFSSLMVFCDRMWKEKGRWSEVYWLLTYSH